MVWWTSRGQLAEAEEEEERRSDRRGKKKKISGPQDSQPRMLSFSLRLVIKLKQERGVERSIVAAR